MSTAAVLPSLFRSIMPYFSRLGCNTHSRVCTVTQKHECAIFRPPTTRPNVAPNETNPLQRPRRNVGCAGVRCAWRTLCCDLTFRVFLCSSQERLRKDIRRRSDSPRRFGSRGPSRGICVKARQQKSRRTKSKSGHLRVSNRRNSRASCAKKSHHRFTHKMRSKRLYLA